MKQVFKFGGSVLQDAISLHKACDIIIHELKKTSNFKIILVISAFAKTTSELEKLCEEIRDEHAVEATLDYLYKFHLSFLTGLGDPFYNKALKDINEIFHQIVNTLSIFNPKIKNINTFLTWDLNNCNNTNLQHPIEKTLLYNEIVTKGEYLATKILYHHLLNKRMICKWLDASHFVKTDGQFEIDYSLMEKSTEKIFSNIKEQVIITQGFVSSNKNNNLIETLGKEGSDYSAAILGSLFNVSKVVLWKDVSGIMNANPNYFKNTHQYNVLSYDNMETIANLGSKVVHPKTLKPLKKKNIPLYVCSFNDISRPGTLIIKDAPVPNPYFIYLRKKRDNRHVHFIKIIFWQKYNIDFFRKLSRKKEITIDEVQNYFITLRLKDPNLDDIKNYIDRYWNVYKKDILKFSI